MISNRVPKGTIDGGRGLERSFLATPPHRLYNRATRSNSLDLAAGWGEMLQVLIAEDDEMVRLSTAECLCDEGFAVIEAANAEDALAHLSGSGPVHALLTDIRMPGSMDGWELATRARVLLPDVAVIYMTGYSDVPASPVSGSMVFNKPYRLKDVAAAIRKLAPTLI